MKLKINEVELDFTGIKLFINEHFNTGSKVKLSRFTIMPGNTTPTDLHDVEELWIITEGEGEIMIEGEKRNITKRDIEYIPKNHKHSIKNTGEDELSIISIWWNS